MFELCLVLGGKFRMFVWGCGFDVVAGCDVVVVLGKDGEAGFGEGINREIKFLIEGLVGAGLVGLV